MKRSLFPVGLSAFVLWAAACGEAQRGDVTAPQPRFDFDLQPLQLDIRPGSDENPINPNSMGLVPVAILGDDSFDVADVDVTTLAFGPDGAAPAHAMVGHLEGVNDDGLTDLVTHYRQKETGLAPGDTEACISGALNDGTPIEGCDAVRVLGN